MPPSNSLLSDRCFQFEIMASPFMNIQVRTNYHEMRFNPSKPIYHYKLEITESTKEKVFEALKLYRPKLNQMLQQFMNIDQNIYSPKLLADSDKGIALGSLPSEGEIETTVMVRLEGKILDKKDQALILSRLFKQVIRNQHQMTSVGNKGQKLFWHARAAKFQDQNLEIWPGVEVILKPGDQNNGQSCIVIDCAFKMLRYKTALEELNAFRNPECLIEQVVMTTYNKKFYKVEGVDINMRPASSFTNEKGETMTYAQYHQQRYKVNVDPNQPLIKATVRSRKDKMEKTVYLIPSLCQMTGLTDAIRNDFNAMKNLATVTKPNAEQRLQQAGSFAQQLCSTEILYKKSGEKKNLFKEWGIEINPNSLDVQARRINPGNLLMGNNTRLELANPSTNLDRQTQTMMYSTPKQTLTCVIIYNRRSGEQTMQQLMQNFNAAVQDFKFDVFSKPLIRPMENDREDELEALSDQLLQESQRNNARVGFVIYLLPGQKKKARLYKASKRIAMQKFGCASQVIIEKTLAKNTRSIVNKILIQLCAKVGGTPWGIDGLPPSFQNQPTMICGTDCFTKAGRLSQLAFCSTVDRNLSRYYSQVITSGEFNTSLQGAMKAALLAFKEQNGIFPKLVMIYRDGVGDGQQAVVLETELPQYQQALRELDVNDAKVVLVVCNKRVSAKFYTSPRPDNPPPGTCIDSKVVCEQKEPNFYLISQITRQGTVTPTLYKILHSDVQGIEDEVKVLTFKLCWLFYNYTGPIKIPAPVRYAHCLCNFIGDNFAKQDKVQFLPVPDLVKQKVLFYI